MNPKRKSVFRHCVILFNFALFMLAGFGKAYSGAHPEHQNSFIIIGSVSVLLILMLDIWAVKKFTDMNSEKQDVRSKKWQ